jgi:O-antigen/teichoic acid export membrane protein
MNQIARLRNAITGTLKSDSLVNTAWLGGGSVASAVLGAVTSALYARALGVESFGVLSLLTSIVVILTAFTDLGISGAIVRFGTESVALNDRGRLKKVTSIAFRAKAILIALVLLVSFFVLNPIFGNVFGHLYDSFPVLFTMSILVVVIAGLNEYMRPIYHAFKKFRRQAGVALALPITKLVLVLAGTFLLARFTLELAVGIEILAIAAGFTVALLFAPYRSFAVRPIDDQLQKKMISFTKWLALYNVIILSGGRADLFLVGALGDAQALGFYGAAVKIISIVIVVANSYLVVLLPDLSSSLTLKALEEKRKHAWVMVGIFALGICLVGVLSPFIVQLVFGSEFAASGQLVRIMCIGVICIVMQFPITSTLFAMNQSVAFPILSGVTVLALIGGSLLLIPHFGVTGAAIAYGIANALALAAVAIYYFIRREEMERSFDAATRRQESVDAPMEPPAAPGAIS